MKFELNNSLEDKKSKKLRKITPIWNYMVKAINENQNIKDFTRNLTRSPLSSKSETYDGKYIVQSHVESDLTKNVGGEYRVLYDNMFNPDIDNQQQVYIFVYPYRISTRDSVAKANFQIIITCPFKFENIKQGGYGNKRTMEIANEIVDIFDEVLLNDGDYSKEVGNIKFNISGSITYERLTKVNDFCLLSLPLEIEYSTVR